MDETQLRLDGNAAAGMLRDVFAYDLSGARGACASCGAIGQMGGQHICTCTHSRLVQCSAARPVRAF